MSSNNTVQFKKGDKVHLKSRQSDYLNYYIIECDYDENLCTVVRVKDETLPFNESRYDEDDYNQFRIDELGQGWIEPELPDEYETQEEYKAEKKRWENFNKRQKEQEANVLRRMREIQAAMSAAGAGSGASVRKYKIGWDEIEVEAGAKVHDKHLLENYILLECYDTRRDGVICKLQVPNNKKITNNLLASQLRPGWISDEVKKEKERQEKMARNAMEKEEQERKKAKLLHIQDLIANTYPFEFGEAIRSFHPKTEFFFRENNGPLMGGFVQGGGDGIGWRVFLYDVVKGYGAEQKFLDGDLYRIKTKVYVDVPGYRKPQASTSSSSAAGAGAGADPSASSVPSETKEEKEKRECLYFLATQGIKSLGDFKSWAAKSGHPNKGGDKELFQKISDCVDKTFKLDKNKSKQGGKRTRKNNKRKTRKH